MFNFSSSSLFTGRRKLRQRQRVRLLQLLGLIIVAIILNVFLFKLGLMLDLKAHERFKIDTITRQVFDSELIANRDEPIDIILAIRSEHPQLTHLKLLLRSYKKLNPQVININWIDPIKEPNRALQIQTKYGITFHNDLIIIDAQIGDDANSSKSKHVRIFNVEDLMVYTKDSQKNRILPQAYREEDMITSQLMGALEGTPKTLLFLKDKSTSNPQILQTLEVLKARLEVENIKWITGYLQDLPALNYDVDAVILISPEKDFSSEELDILQTYWNKSYSSILVALNPRYPLSRLKSFLREQGIRARSDVLVQNQASNLISSSFVDTDVHTAAFRGIPTSFRGLSGSLEVYSDDPKLQLKQLYPQALIQADAGYWGETTLPIENATFDIGQDYAENLYIAAKVERRYEINNEELSSYLFVFSTSDFIAVNNLSLEQGHYLLSTINEMVNRYELMGISQTPLVVSQLDLSQKQLDLINLIWLVILPIGILLIGLMVWITRRR